MAVTKPITYPRWATTLELDATSGQYNRVEPSEGQKDSGWTRGGTPPRQYENWYKNLNYDWVLWFDQEVTQNTVDITANASNIATNASTISSNYTSLDGRITALEPPTLTGFTSFTYGYIDDDGDGQGDNFFSADTTLTPGTWESVGPTGSGAVHIWTAIDALPLGIASVQLKIQMIGYKVTTGSGSAFTSARRTGSSASATANSAVRVCSLLVAGDGTNSIYGSDTSFPPVPVDSSNRFDLYFTSGTMLGVNSLIHLVKGLN